MVRSALLASRVDARYCSTRCRQAAHRAGVRRAELAATAAPLRLAYADPPYPGKSGLYRGEPGYAGEVDLEELLWRLASFDGWALSTSAEALPVVLAVAVARGLDVRVAAWMRSARPHATARLLNGWEPVVFAGARQLPGSAPQAVDALVGVAPRRRSTRPGAVIGAKPTDFCCWLFGLLGALPGDSLEDLYPGSGIVSWAWRRWTSQPVSAASSAEG
ncbi:MAG: hypothetical protein QOD83_2208 [Solirubrobacteraceae bacterium]|nr:hypothetical protein [Solirubrobacteraceae bacterium]